MLKGLGDLGKMGGVLKKAMEMKNRLEEMKEELKDVEVEASAGGGMVKVLMNGKSEVLKISIEPEVIDKDDAEMLETLVRAAVNDALDKTRAMMKEKMKEAAGGLDIPGIT